ncbi:MAG: TIGR00266 family protein, partial [Nevskiales bacterium]
AKVTGPGTVWIQSLPFSRLASRVFACAPQNGGSSDRAGSGSGAGVLGGLAAGGILGGLGSLLGGDDD